MATVGLGNLFHDGQSDAVAGGRFVETCAALQQRICGIGRDTRTVVFDNEQQAALPVAVIWVAYRYPHSFLAPLARVIEQIPSHLEKVTAVATKLHVVIDGRLDVRTLVVVDLAQSRDESFYFRGDRHMRQNEVLCL